MESWELKNVLNLAVPKARLRSTLSEMEALTRSERHLLYFLACIGRPADYRTIMLETAMSKSLMLKAKAALAQRGLITVERVAI